MATKVRALGRDCGVVAQFIRYQATFIIRAKSLCLLGFLGKGPKATSRRRNMRRGEGERERQAHYLAYIRGLILS